VPAGFAAGARLGLMHVGPTVILGYARRSAVCPHALGHDADQEPLSPGLLSPVGELAGLAVFCWSGEIMLERP